MWKYTLTALLACQSSSALAWSTIANANANANANAKPSRVFLSPCRTDSRAASLEASRSEAEPSVVVVDDPNNLSRRKLLAMGSVLVAAAGGVSNRPKDDDGSFFVPSDDVLPTTMTTTNQQLGGQRSSPVVLLQNLDDVMQVLESSVDKRFLHAVIASDYQSLYVKSPTVASRRTKLPVIASAVTCLAKNHNDVEHAPFLRWNGSLQAQLVEQLHDRPIQVEQSLVVHTNLRTATDVWGSDVVSVWPLQNIHGPSRDRIHYAWPVEDGDFATVLENSRSSDNSNSNRNSRTGDRNGIIVDGIDCGRMSLEDALEGNRRQVLVQAEQFLFVPVRFEMELRKRLQTAFLI